MEPGPESSRQSAAQSAEGPPFAVRRRLLWQRAEDSGQTSEVRDQIAQASSPTLSTGESGQPPALNPASAADPPSISMKPTRVIAMVVLAVAAIATVAVLIVPPWRFEINAPHGQYVHRHTGHHLIWSPPKIPLEYGDSSSYWTAAIDGPRLWMLIAVCAVFGMIGGALLFFARSREVGPADRADE